MTDGTIPPELHEKYLKIILFETERLTDLTHDLLTLNEFDTNHLLLNREVFDIHEMIKHVAASFEGVCTQKKISIELVFATKHLNGGSVKDATAQKIKKIIEENNYEPNLFARLNAKESRIIGLTVPGFNSVTTPRLVEVIVAYLKKNDYTPLIMHTENDIEEEIRCIERLKNMNVDGIMVLATGSTKEYEEAVKKLKIPILFLGQRFPGENSVINDDYNAGYAVGNYIGQRKFKEIYMLWVPEDDPAVGGERRHGVIDGLMSCEKKPKEVIETTFFYENAIENVQKFVDYGNTHL